MTWHFILYNALLVTCVPYALVRGGAPERWCAGIAFLATLLSVFALSRSAIVYEKAEVGTFAVDLLALAGFFAVALFADRFWPLLVAGLQADGVIIHLCKLIQPDILPLGYAIGLSIWSYPILILIASGTLRHRRRLANRGSDPAWSMGRRSALPPVVFGDAYDPGGSAHLHQSRDDRPVRRTSTGGS